MHKILAFIYFAFNFFFFKFDNNAFINDKIKFIKFFFYFNNFFSNKNFEIFYYIF